MSRRKDVFCAFCKNPHRVYTNRSIGWVHLVSAAALCAGFSYFIWQDLDLRGLVFFGLAILAAEITFQIRWRASIVCKDCGFDPALYVKHPEQAAEKVRLRLEQRKTDPSVLLSRPVVLPKRSTQPFKKGVYLNKKVEFNSDAQ